MPRGQLGSLVRAGASTEKFITTHWHSQKYAGTVVNVPLVFAAVDYHFPHPGYPVQAERRREQGGVLVVVTFDHQGYVSKCWVYDATASDILQKSTCDFIKANWHSKTFADRTESVPVIYMLH